MKRDIVLIAHNLRSCHNVGSLLRTAEGLGIERIYLTGYTPYPLTIPDDRLPHIAAKVDKQISKTALGAETHMAWDHNSDIKAVITKLSLQSYTIVALEQTDAVRIDDWAVPKKTALIIGRETEGIESEVLGLCDIKVEIPMAGQKESFNVVQAAAMAMFYCKFSK